MSQPRTPITIVTGFAGAGKTTLILKLLPQLRAEHPGYKLALIKNEIGDLNVDTQLAAASEMTGSRELLGDCICCTNVGQIGSALEELEKECHPDRIIIETSGSAEPLKLVIEINRLAKETGKYELDGIVSVIDAENWSGYANTSYTAKLQAQQTDLIVINKWESLSERAYDLFLDKLGDLDVDTPQTKSDRGWISKDLLFGFDTKMARTWHSGEQQHKHDHDEPHKAEIECLSITLASTDPQASVDLNKLEQLLTSSPKDEIYRIKAVVWSRHVPKDLPIDKTALGEDGSQSFVLNWSFGRWTWSPLGNNQSRGSDPPLRLVIFTAQYESTKWAKKLESSSFFVLDGSADSKLTLERIQ